MGLVVRSVRYSAPLMPRSCAVTVSSSPSCRLAAAPGCLSPDPHIQDEGLLQNYDRYSYVLNNPLRYTDPNGELWLHVAAFVIGAALASSSNKDLKIVGTLMMMVAMQGVGAEGGLLQAAAAGETILPAISSVVSATIANTIAYGPEAGIKAGLFAAAFTGAGEIGKVLSPERIIAHALLGCLQQATSGGKCGPGAAAAAFGKIATGVASEVFGLNDFGSKFAVTTVVGGTASVIGGGKFANGAAQAGFGYLFNELASAMKEERRQTRGWMFGFHEYENWTPCTHKFCTDENLLKALKETPAVSPRINGRSFPLIGLVDHIDGDRDVLNRTVDGKHVLSPGVVNRSIQVRDGVIGIATYGVGWGFWPAANEWAARPFWKAADKAIFHRIYIENKLK
jgi:hypothetical protein